MYVHVPISSKFAGYLLVWFLVWHVVILAMVILPKNEPVMVMCPNKRTVHSVGSDLRTSSTEFDKCSIAYQEHIEQW